MIRVMLIYAILLLLPLKMKSQSASLIGVFSVMFDEPSPKVQDYGDPIVLKLRDANAIKQRLHARIFRGSQKDLANRLPDADGCVRFDTVTADVIVRGNIQLQGMGDLTWLQPSKNGFLPEDYTVVFESGDQPTDSVIRIHKIELEVYFKSAFEIKLLPPPNVAIAPQIVEKARIDLADRSVVFQKITSSVCWNVQSVASGELLHNPKEQIAKLAARLVPMKCSETPEFFARSALPTNKSLTNGSLK